MFIIIYKNGIMVDYNKHSEREASVNKEELEEKLAKAGIKGEWVNADKYGFSRIFKFTLDNQIIQIEWYCNYCTIIIGNARFWFDHININSCYPEVGEWIEFSFRGEHPLHLKVR